MRYRAVYFAEDVDPILEGHLATPVDYGPWRDDWLEAAHDLRGCGPGRVEEEALEAAR